MLYVGKQLVSASFPYNKELYNPAEAELNVRYSNSQNKLIASDGYVITGYIDIREVMKHSDPRLDVYLNSNMVPPFF